jgi:hypothetical protein
MCPPSIPKAPPPLKPPKPPEESAVRNLEGTDAQRKKNSRRRRPGIGGLTIPLSLPALSASGMREQ